MLEIQWEYLEKNISTGYSAVVAILRPKNNPNQWILRVHTNCSYHYCNVNPEYNFLKPNPLPYYVESKKRESQHDSISLRKLSAHDDLVLILKEGCKIIEEDCKSQAERILNLISQ